MHTHCFVYILQKLSICHILRVETTEDGVYDPEIRTWLRFLYNAPTHQVSSSYVSSFRSYHADTQTNKKEILYKTSTSLCYGMPVENAYSLC